MADLDDFFAKKDKKKSKKPKFLTAEELVKNLEETSKRELVKPKKVESTIQMVNAGIINDTANANEQAMVEEEWKEFQEEQRKDYTGLKIGQLTLNDDDDQSLNDSAEEDGDGNDNGDGMNGSGGGGSEGVGLHSSGSGSGSGSGISPWKKVIPADEVTQIPLSTVKVPAYKARGPSLNLKAKQRNKAAPDITNADFFPTLGAARPEEQRKKKNEPAFEEVRHGGRIQKLKEAIAAPINVTNRFQTLDETES